MYCPPQSSGCRHVNPVEEATPVRLAALLYHRLAQAGVLGTAHLHQVDAVGLGHVREVFRDALVDAVHDLVVALVEHLEVLIVQLFQRFLFVSASTGSESSSISAVNFQPSSYSGDSVLWTMRLQRRATACSLIVSAWFLVH